VISVYACLDCRRAAMFAYDVLKCAGHKVFGRRVPDVDEKPFKVMHKAYWAVMAGREPRGFKLLGAA
jgi:hypothetical protein